MCRFREADAGTTLTIPSDQRTFPGGIRSAALTDQLFGRFNDRQHYVTIKGQVDTALVQIGSKHGTPVTVHISDAEAGVLVAMSHDRDWLYKLADSSKLIERATSNLLSLLAILPDVICELKQKEPHPACLGCH